MLGIVQHQAEILRACAANLANRLAEPTARTPTAQDQHRPVATGGNRNRLDAGSHRTGIDDDDVELIAQRAEKSTHRANLQITCRNIDIDANGKQPDSRLRLNEIILAQRATVQDLAYTWRVKLIQHAAHSSADEVAIDQHRTMARTRVAERERKRNGGLAIALRRTSHHHGIAITRCSPRFELISKSIDAVERELMSETIAGGVGHIGNHAEPVKSTALVGQLR